jgi:hypothetical protein
MVNFDHGSFNFGVTSNVFKDGRAEVLQWMFGGPREGKDFLKHVEHNMARLKFQDTPIEYSCEKKWRGDSRASPRGGAIQHRSFRKTRHSRKKTEKALLTRKRKETVRRGFPPLHPSMGDNSPIPPGCFATRTILLGFYFDFLRFFKRIFRSIHHFF